MAALGAATGLLVLADLRTTAITTALEGGATWRDVCNFCPGLHRQAEMATQLNNNEYPAVGALTSGYVFRVENPATVFYLQRISTAGAVTRLAVSPGSSDSAKPMNLFSGLFQGLVPLYWILGPFAIIDRFVIALIVGARALNIASLIHRAKGTGWHGASEPGVQGDLLVLLSQDRWVRITGQVDDLKAVLSGQWLREPSAEDSMATTAATMMVYIAAGLSINMGWQIKWTLLIMLILSGMLGTATNNNRKHLVMHGRKLAVDEAIAEPVKRYKRRLDLVDELLSEEGRNDVAMKRALRGMGMMPAADGSTEQVIM